MTAGNDTEEKIRSRLEPVEEATLDPWVRAPAITDNSIYWMPVDPFPMLPQQREWIDAFHGRLATQMKSRFQLREEVFLQFKALYPDLLDRFTSTSSQFMPVSGMSLRPGEQPKALPDLESIRKQVEAATKNGTGVDTNVWMPDYLQWFVRKLSAEQRASFLGYGGLLTLYIAPDPATVAPALKLPGFFTSMPIYDDSIQANLDAGFALRDAFLNKSKEVFGEPFREDPSYKGMAFILPLLSSQSILDATPEQRQIWFSVFDGYLIESKQDRGMILAVKDPAFDEVLKDLIKQMREDGLVYRS